jgi:hypothetical protein
MFRSVRVEDDDEVLVEQSWRPDATTKEEGDERSPDSSRDQRSSARRRPRAGGRRMEFL